MSPKSGSTGTVTILRELEALGGGLLSVFATHSEWPTMRFRLTYSGQGQLIGLDVSDTRAAASRDRLLPTDAPLDADDWDPPPLELVAQVRRDLPIAQINRVARAHVVERFGSIDDDFGQEFGATRVGRRGHEPEFYARLAIRYAQLAPFGNPLQHLGRERHYSESTVKKLVRQCRARGFLTAAPPGKAGGYYTEECERVLGKATLKALLALEVSLRPPEA